MPNFPVDDASWAKYVADFVTANAETLARPLVAKGKKVTAALRTRLRRTYESYLNRLVEKYGHAKTFFIRDQLTPIYKYYVPLSAKCGSKRVSVVDAASMEGLGRNLVIDGSGGCGKSTLLRHLCLNEIVRKRRVPILFELRSLNESDSSDDLLWDALCSTVRGLDKRMNEDLIHATFEAGLFTVLLDGYDEVIEEKRAVVARQIRSLADEYPESNFWIASRPDPCFNGWDDFSVVSTLPLSEDQACALVEKLPVDVDLRDKFIKDLRETLFAKHESFLSNPLLLTIMLLTYGQSAEIPKRLSVFYDQAYSALFHNHDALKGGFRRERQSRLDVQDFATMFAAFSIQSYDAEVTHMTEPEANDYIRKATEITSLAVGPQEFLTDSLQAVCLLIKDGLEIHFSHRSFQEYFAAKFIASQPRGVKQKLINKYSRRFLRDATLPLLYELQPDAVEAYLFIPHLAEIDRICQVKRKVGISHWLRYVKASFELILIGPESAGLGVTVKLSRHDRPWIDSFILRKMNLTPKRPKSSADLQRLHKLAIKHHGNTEDPEKMLEISSTSLTTRDVFTKALYRSGVFFSGEHLARLYVARKKLIEKRDLQAESVKDILNL